ncbi:MAG TPA: T9SS type A sorting domain-containing protein [Bacteroidetes bacterium]|nr:T9SS type A sorting domain-containing protein [Bacteroidota bacterium]
MTLSDNAGKCAFFQNPDDEDKRLHGGTTLCTFDADSDGDKEVLYGDLIYPNIIFAKNGGTSDDAWMNEQDTLFPSYDIAVHIPDFPASYYLDINNDGADDLLFSPNLPSGSPDVNTAVFYKNTGIGGEQEFQFQQNNFLAEGMLDFGTGANPVFADVNADGLLDIVVGNRSEWDTLLDKSYLALLLNTGTASEPAYELTDRDWLGLSQYNPDIRALSPAFGDLDGDGDEDLLIGSRTGPLHFFENTAPPGQPMQFAPPVFNWQGIVVGANTTPFIFDVNNDGLLDLLIGERAGNINYFPNIGDPAHPQFHPQEEEAPNNEFFGEITTIAPGGAIGYSQPFAMRSAAGSFIIVGTDAGWLKRYKINPDLLDGGAFELLDEKLGNLREGFISRVCFANINGNNFLEAVVGNDRGGISLFQSPLTIEGLVGNKENYDGRQIGIYPNPVNDFIFIEIKGSAAHFPVAWEVSSPAGRLVLSGTVFSGNKIDVSTLGSGLYFIKIKTKEGIMTEKIVVRHE